jgi:hypothetical protein
MPCSDGGWSNTGSYDSGYSDGRNSQRREDRQQIQRLEKKLNREVTASKSIEQALEEELCVARDVIMKVLKYVDEDNLPSTLKEMINNQKELHLEHRLEDKEASIEKYSELIAEIQNREIIIEKMGGVLSDEMNDELKSLREKRKYVLGLSDEELLSDRDLF